MAEGYEYDLFLSYRREGDVGEWVRNHFHDRLRNCLNSEFPRPVRIFFDVGQEPGTHWRKNIARALQRSHLLVAVLSPQYFTSSWCLAEWNTIRRREERLGFGREGDPQG